MRPSPCLPFAAALALALAPWSARGQAPGGPAGGAGEADGVQTPRPSTSPRASSAASAPSAPAAPSGLVLMYSNALGPELFAERRGGGNTLAETELLIGYDVAPGIRPELAGVLGIEPDLHGGIRLGVRLSLPALPVQLRVALDASNARNRTFDWRFLLVGAAQELHLTSSVSVCGEIDTGVPLRSGAGLPLLFRVGAVVRM